MVLPLPEPFAFCDKCALTILLHSQILTIQPPTYEIFTMTSRVALISTGRLMYFGRRREMLPYFAFINFPCPAFKNPSDYYSE